jgi:ADP-ribosylglycohydrolase
MLGAIIGDTVGSAYEFHNTKDYNFRLFLSESNYTDDSVMTMAVAYWLLSDPKHTYQKLEDAMLLFAENCPCPMGGYGTGFYYWLFRPGQLRPFDSRYGESPYRSKSGRHPYGSFGNGSAMRVSAVGWFFDTLEETERVAAISAAITHNHPEGVKGAQATAASIFLARTGKNKEEIRDYIEKTYGYDLHKTWEYWHPIYEWEDSCQGTVPPAIIAFLDSTDFEDAIRKAVSLGGDSDTLACITSGIAEAFYKEIPKEMADRVQGRFPDKFVHVLSSVKEKTVYGTTCKISE